jgi:hypothetical protein
MAISSLPSTLLRDSMTLGSPFMDVTLSAVNGRIVGAQAAAVKPKSLI